jgi:hypothetical protein
MKRSMIFSFLLMSLFACQKQESFRHPDQLTDETIIEGHVRDPWGAPLPGALVNCSVLAGKAYQNTWSYLLPALTTDSNGYYRFHHTDTRDVIGYEVKASLDGYYAPGIRQAQKHWHNIRDFELRPHAWIRVHIKNVDPVDINDRCRFYMTSFTGHQWIVGGMDVDKSQLFKGAGGTPSTMHWRVTKGGEETVYHDTLILAGHDTTYYLIEF